MPDESISDKANDDKPEEWRPICGYEGHYEVSSLGRVRSLPRKVYSYSHPSQRHRCRNYSGRIMIHSPDKDGYRILGLRMAGEHRTHKVHALVARAFLGPKPDGMQINHLDSVRSNNVIDNLEYVTAQGNSTHAVSMGRTLRGDQHPSRLHPERVARGEKSGMAKLNADAIIDIRNRFASGEPVRLIAYSYSITYQAVAAIVKRKIWKHIP